MLSYSLEINEFCCTEYVLIGVHSPLEDYKLAYLFNKYLQVKFKRAKYDLDFEEKKNTSSYPVYEYYDKKLDNNWFLIANVFKEKRENTIDSLFNESYVRTYLIPEKKKVDYFIKIEGDVAYERIVKTIDKINQIAQIATSYTIDSSTLKSKENLIF